ncbi:tobamovirus multiplication protein 1-like [Pyrus ussuriensis x Pyrus communis]|uniref:Tobamovirus multiplication protein 1-like n=1 Tax=Pyrus ussuriensis x Pyrus communis TaxID=2448454 RepID=A0A5N5FJN4_9ROSA|nr:tobamovirus multiplication protein 1-like [Pyrus ussuriensis x Pyrus communis]
MGEYCILSASYGLVSLVALVQLGRIQLRVPEYGWTIQKVFHLMNFLENGLRALLFGLYKTVFLIKPKALEMLLMDLPGLLFFSTYALLVLFWAEIYHQVCIWILLRLSRSPVAVEVARIFFSVISFCSALGFLIYAPEFFVFFILLFMLIFCSFSLWPSTNRRYEMYSYSQFSSAILAICVGWVTGICCTCFLIRCIVLAGSAFDKDADVDVIGRPILNLAYYMSAEIVPSALVLFILRKPPPRYVSDQYQPIRILAYSLLVISPVCSSF